MKQKFSGINNYFINGEFNKAIPLAEKLLISTKNKKLKGELFCKLGWMHDQQALLIKRGTKFFQDKALRYFKKCMEHDRFTALRGIATVYHHQNNIKKALYYYKEAFKLKPRNQFSLNDFGTAYQRMWFLYKKPQYLKKARKYYELGIRRATGEMKLSPLINLSLLYSKSKNIEKAQKFARQALIIIRKRKINRTFKRWENVLEKITNY